MASSPNSEPRPEESSAQTSDGAPSTSSDELASASPSSTSPGSGTAEPCAAVGDAGATASESASDRKPAKKPRDPVPPKPPVPSVGELNVLCYTLLALFVITTAVWAVFSWADYNKRYAQAPDFWGRGTTRTVEITLVREDVDNLACASDLNIEGLHCGFRRNQRPSEVGNADERLVLRPYNTVDHVLFLGAGLWSSPKLQQELPFKRFSVVCDFQMLEAVKQADLRWSPTGKFTPLNRSVPAGTLSNCEIPKW